MFVGILNITEHLVMSSHIGHLLKILLEPRIHLSRESQHLMMNKQMEQMEGACPGDEDN